MPIKIRDTKLQWTNSGYWVTLLKCPIGLIQSRGEAISFVGLWVPIWCGKGSKGMK